MSTPAVEHLGMEMDIEAIVPEYELDALSIPATLAVELVAGLSSASEIFDRHGIPPKHIPAILSSSVFKGMLQEAKREWGGEQNAEHRIRAKARIALEELLIPQFALAKNVKTPATARNDAAKFFKSLAGMDRPEAAEGGAEKFVVNITLGSHRDRPETIVIDGSSQENLE